MGQTASSEQGFFRSFFWPVYGRENRKLLPMFVLLFLINFNYSVLRCLKDALIIPAAGAEAIPYIKVWLLLPMAMILTFIFTRLSNRFSQERVIYLLISGFLIFYALFAFIFYPLRDVLHPHQTADFLMSALPKGMKGLIAVFRFWSFASFYVMAELWGTIVMTVLFWGFANEITKSSEAHRFYAVLTLGANCAAIAAGQFASCISLSWTFHAGFPFGCDAWEQVLVILVSAVILSGVLTMVIFKWMNTYVLSGASFDEWRHKKKEFKETKKLSIRESFTYLARSKYLICIAILVISYNLVSNLVEVLWKDRLGAYIQNKAEYNAFMSNLTSLIGLSAAIMAFFVSPIILRFKWTFAAVITPAIFLVTSVIFFSFILFGESLPKELILLCGATPLAGAVLFGTLQYWLSKASKYSIFDATKEMAFIPLSHESQVKGKAAIDGVGSRFGKSGGSLIYQILFMIFGGLSMSVPYVVVIVLCVIILWISAAYVLGREFSTLTEGEALQSQEKPVVA